MIKDLYLRDLKDSLIQERLNGWRNSKLEAEKKQNIGEAQYYANLLIAYNNGEDIAIGGYCNDIDAEIA